MPGKRMFALGSLFALICVGLGSQHMMAEPIISSSLVAMEASQGEVNLLGKRPRSDGSDSSETEYIETAQKRFKTQVSIGVCLEMKTNNYGDKIWKYKEDVTEWSKCTDQGVDSVEWIPIRRDFASWLNLTAHDLHTNKDFIISNQDLLRMWKEQTDKAKKVFTEPPVFKPVPLDDGGMVEYAIPKDAGLPLPFKKPNAHQLDLFNKVANLPFAHVTPAGDEVELSLVKTLGWTKMENDKKKGLCTPLVTEALKVVAAAHGVPKEVNMLFAADPALNGCICYLQAVYEVFQKPFKLSVNRKGWKQFEQTFTAREDASKFCKSFCNNGEGCKAITEIKGPWRLRKVVDEVRHYLKELYPDGPSKYSEYVKAQSNWNNDKYTVDSKVDDFLESVDVTPMTDLLNLLQAAIEGLKGVTQTNTKQDQHASGSEEDQEEQVQGYVYKAADKFDQTIANIIQSTLTAKEGDDNTGLLQQATAWLEEVRQWEDQNSDQYSVASVM